MSNRFCYIWPSTTDHGTSVIDRIPLKSSTMAKFIERFWLTTATTLALLTTTPTEQRMRRRSKTRINYIWFDLWLSCDQIWPEINSYFDLICVSETKIGGSNRLTLDTDPDQVRSRLVKRGPWTTPPGISWAYGEICVLLTHLFLFIGTWKGIWPKFPQWTRKISSCRCWCNHIFRHC